MEGSKARPKVPASVADTGGKRGFGSQNKPSEALKGRWSAAEDKVLLKQTKAYLALKNRTLDEFRLTLTNDERMKNRGETKDFVGLWVSVAKFFPERSVESVRNRGERLLHPSRRQGKWDDKSTAQLIDLVSKHGRKWVMIGNILERDPNAVRDKYRLVGEKEAGFHSEKIARWSKEDEDKFIAFMRSKFPKADWDAEQPKNIPLYDLPWTEICQHMNKSKSACWEKWHGSLHPRAAKYRAKRWTGEDFSPLVESIYRSGALEEDQIEWERLTMRYSPKVCKSQWRVIMNRNRNHFNPDNPSFRSKVLILARRYCPHLNISENALQEDLPESEPNVATARKRVREAETPAAEATKSATKKPKKSAGLPTPAVLAANKTKRADSVSDESGESLSDSSEEEAEEPTRRKKDKDAKKVESAKTKDKKTSSKKQSKGAEAKNSKSSGKKKIGKKKHEKAK